MTTSLGRRNLTLEICKLIGACFVVFIHVPFPWPAGELVLCLARFAVPLFFAVSGWYSYRATPEKLLRRMGHVLLLELAGIVIVQLWGCFAAVYTGRSLLEQLKSIVPGREALARWLLFQDDPYGGQLWYLSASAFVYGVLWLYSRFGRERWGYRPLYVLGAFLLAAHFCMGELSRFTGLEVYFRNYRTGALMGLPLCLMGLFLREHRQTLLDRLNTPRLLMILLLGTGLSVAEWRCFGVQELYGGLLLSVPALMLLTSLHPGVPRWLEKAAAACGPVSTGIYLMHLVVYDIYLAFFQWRVEVYFGAAEPWLQPFGVLGLSMAAALAWMLVLGGMKKLLKRK